MLLSPSSSSLSTLSTAAGATGADGVGADCCQRPVCGFSLYRGEDKGPAQWDSKHVVGGDAEHPAQPHCVSRAATVSLCPLSSLTSCHVLEPRNPAPRCATVGCTVLYVHGVEQLALSADQGHRFFVSEFQ